VPTDAGTPGWVDRLNALGEAVGRPAGLVSLDADDLVAEASRSTGLHDFGPGPWRDHFEVLVASLDAEARLHALGRLLTRYDLVRTLRNRLFLAPLFPAVANERVDEPVFVLGPARSGTSILFELLAQDPRFRTPASWEVHHPVPPPEAATYETDERIALVQREVTFWNDVRPEYQAMHEEGAQLPKECIFITAHTFNSDYWTAIADVPSYNAQRFSWDAAEPYRYHRRFLQVLQSRHRRDHWLLKAPSHLFTLQALFAEYPDARVIHTHRDPRMTAPSTISLTRAFRAMRSDVTSAPDTLPGLGMGFVLGQVVEWRTTGAVPDDRFADVHYADLVRDPIAALRDVYERFEWRLSDATARAMVSYLASKPRTKHGEHRYSLTEYGLDDQMIARAFGAYVEHYGIERER